jgi:hypothetical protein
MNLSKEEGKALKECLDEEGFRDEDEFIEELSEIVSPDSLSSTCSMWELSMDKVNDHTDCGNDNLRKYLKTKVITKIIDDITNVSIISNLNNTNDKDILLLISLGFKIVNIYRGNTPGRIVYTLLYSKPLRKSDTRLKNYQQLQEYVGK